MPAGTKKQNNERKHMHKHSLNIEVDKFALGELELLAERCRKSPAELAATFIKDAVDSYCRQPEELAGTFAAV